MNMKKEQNTSQTTEPAIAVDTVLAPVNVMQLIHDFNMAIIFSDLIPEKTCGDFADIMNKVLTKHNLLTEYQDYIKRFAGLPPSF